MITYQAGDVVAVQALVSPDGDWQPTSVSAFVNTIDGCPYVVVRPENVAPWPDAERERRLEAALREAWDWIADRIQPALGDDVSILGTIGSALQPARDLT